MYYYSFRAHPSITLRMDALSEVECAPIAQLDRALAYGASCCWFDSSWAHHLSVFIRHVKKTRTIYARGLKGSERGL